MGRTKGAFVGFGEAASRSKTNPATTATSTALSPLCLGDDADIVADCKGCLKRDAGTRLKSVRQLRERAASAHANLASKGVCRPLRTALPHVLWLQQRLSLDDDRRVREASALLVSALLALPPCAKAFAGLRGAAAGGLWLAAADPDASAAAAAAATLELCGAPFNA